MVSQGAAGVGPAMLGVGLVYAGLLVAAIGLLALLHPLRRLGVPTRRRAAAAVGMGVLVFAAGALLPAPLRRAAGAVTHFDRIVPEWQFAEHHEITIAAEPAQVDAAIREVTAREIRLFRLLTWIRNPGRSWSEQPANILAPPADEPILAVVLRSGFWLLAEEPGRELVLGTLVITPPEVGSLPPADHENRRQGFTPDRFRDLASPGYAKAAMNFHLTAEAGGRTRLTTATRVFATDAGTRRAFAVYWRLIYPGSALIRRMWLRAIRERAEGAFQPPGS